MDSDDLREIRDRTGVPYMSLYGLRIQIRQLAKGGFSLKETVRILSALHPLLMPNLKLGLFDKISLKDPALVWIRSGGWIRRGVPI